MANVFLFQDGATLQVIILVSEIDFAYNEEPRQYLINIQSET